LRSALLAFLLLISGLCGISYEVLYGRILGNLVGDQFAVSASILLTFLLGIGFGTLFAHRLWRHLWLLEGAIGLCGVVLALSTGPLDRLLFSLPMASAGLFATLAICVAILIVPAFLIGTSLPIFAGYTSCLTSGLVFARTYAIYNFGAAITVLLIEFWLIRALGIRNATFCIAGFNAFVAIVLLTAFDELRSQAPMPSRTRGIRYTPSQLVALGLASVASAIFQLLMIKLAESLYGPFRETFALVLCLILLGIALGSTLARSRPITFRFVLLANLVGLVWLLGGFVFMAQNYAALYPTADSYVDSVLLKLFSLALVMGLPALTFGATIPALITDQHDISKESGQLLFVSSLANAFGFLLMAFVLHERFDYGVLVLIIAALVSVALVVHEPKLDRRLPLVALLLLAAVYAHRYSWDEDLLYLGYTTFHSAEDLEEDREAFEFPEKFKGAQDVFSILWFNGKPYFYINGYISIPLRSPSEKIVGALASHFAPRADRALVLGVGSGATAATVGLLFDHTDAIEINQVVLDNLFRMKEYNFDIESNPRVNLVHGDAIRYAKASREKYSLIINTVTTPLYFSSSKLYTLDFLEAIRGRLEPDGVYVTWVDSRVGERGLDIMLKTLGSGFDHCSLAYIKAAYYLLMCSQVPVQVHQPRLVADHPILARHFLGEHGIKPDWLPYNLLHGHAVDLLADPDVPVNTLNNPVLDFEMAHLRERSFSGFKARLPRSMSLADVFRAFPPAMNPDPVALVKQAEIMLDDPNFTPRWRELVSEQEPDFEERYAQVTSAYEKEYAGALNDESSPRAYFGLGVYFMDVDRYAKAIEAFEKALAIDPKRNNAYYNIGSGYEHMREYPAAIENFRAELSVDPEDEDVPYRVGRVLVKMNRYEEALEELSSELIDEENSLVHYYRARAHEGLGNTPEAIRAYSEMLRLDPDDEDAVEALERLQGSDTARSGSG
jgi:predicted membrane-bound spermidine synthase/thioredoxin-like negative regulator of GroEL